MLAWLKRMYLRWTGDIPDWSTPAPRKHNDWMGWR